MMKNLAFTVEIPAAEQEKRKALGYGTKVEKGFFRKMKDIAYMLSILADATLYSEKFLYDRFEEELEDTGDYNSAWENVRDVSLEYDW